MHKLLTGTAALILGSGLGVSQIAVVHPERAATLAEHGHCTEALPLLKKSIAAHLADADLKRRIGVAGVRCGMSLNEPLEAVTFLTWLNREFPHDAAVLYLATHVYSDLSTHASQELLFSAPGSPEVHELNAEALEMQGKWQEAISEYRVVLAGNPSTPGIHYRLGRLLLSEPETPASKQEARKEFEEELKIDPANAGAEFVLGELARQAEQWPDAIEHFGQAAKLDAGFFEAYLGLGRALLGSGRNEEAVAPLEKAAKLSPENTMVHFELATAYRRTGRKADADREFAVHKEVTEKARLANENVAKGVNGGAVSKSP